MTKEKNIPLSDLDYMRSTSAALLEQTPKRSIFLLYAIIGLIISFGFWMFIAQLDEVTRGDGKVIPSKKIQVIQNLEGGIISEILVKEGMYVEKDQILLQIDDNNFESNFMESRLRYFEMLAKTSRLQAEADGLDTFTVPDEVIKNGPQLEKNEQLFFTSRKKALKQKVEVIKYDTQKMKHQVTEAKSKAKQILRNLKLAKDEYKIIQPLYKSGAVSQVKLIQVKRQVVNYESEYKEIKSSLPRLYNAIKESKGKEKEVYSNFKNEARKELNITLAEIPRIQESIESLEDKLTRTSVRSPVKGTIKQLFVNTINGVVQPGMDLVEIVPSDDKLLIEAKVRPADIAYIYPGQLAKVKFTAYDSSKYGSLNATVIFISADTILEDKNGRGEEPFYRVRVKTYVNYLQSIGQRLPIIPGMVAEVDILTGSKSIFDYLFKPILKAKDIALTER